MLRPLDEAGSVGRRAVAETEYPVDGDTWFWTDDNAKVLEFLSRPELWRRFSVEMGAILHFVRGMCREPFILRRVARPRLEFTETDTSGFARYRHALMNIGHDLPSGVVSLGMRYHDTRSSDIHLTGNHVEFTHAGRRYRLPVEPVSDDVVAVHEGQRLTLRHAGELYFSCGGRQLRLGQIAYTYSFDARSMAIEAEAALELVAGLAVSDVVLTIGHQHLSACRDAVIAADTPGAGAPLFAASYPTRRRISVAGASYYQIRQGRISGDALAIHSRPREPGRLTEIEVAVRRPWVPHRVVARYTFPGLHNGARLVAGEHKMLTAGGLYDRVADYVGFLHEAVAARDGEGGGTLDYSIPYDYGSVINAFAKCFAVCAAGAVPEAPLILTEELKALFDAYLDTYFRYYIDDHESRPDAIFSRELSFVVLGVVTAYRATGAPEYRQRLVRLCDVLLDFELPLGMRDGVEVSAFLMRTHSPVGAPADCQSASLLALTRAASVVGDPRLLAAIDRGLGSYHLKFFESYQGQAHRFEAVSTVMAYNYRRQPALLSRLRALRHRRVPQDGADPIVWSYKAGLTLRFFAALRQSEDPALRAIAARHRERLDRCERVLRDFLASTTTPRDIGIEIRNSPLSPETNSETQPWAMLGLLGHPFD
jgi:hypothetical protein